MNVQPFYDPRTSTLTYVVSDPVTKAAVVIDPVLDFDPATGRIWTESVDAVDAHLKQEGLSVAWILETHAHADHLSGSQELKRRLGAGVAISRRITQVQETFAPVFGFGPEVPRDGHQFDRLLDDGEVIEAGGLRIEVVATPGHTPACTTFRVGDALFTGDALFLPDSGVGRCDFPGGSADAMYTSIHDRLYTLPDATRVFVGHDYQPGGRAVAWETTIGRSKAENVQLRGDTSREAFVLARNARDATLAAPKLLLPSLQVNVDAGRLPTPDADGARRLRLPLKLVAA